MKLFIWTNPYRVRYGMSSLHVVAETVEKARALACSNKAVTLTYGTRPQKQADWTGIVLDSQPDEIVDLPCAVWDHWEE